VVGKNTRRAIPLVSATLTIVGSVIAFKLTASLSSSRSWGFVLGWMAAGIIVTYLLSRVQARSQEQSPEAIKERVTELEPELRKQVQARSYGTRRQLIEAPLRELDLDITPRVGWVRDPRLVEPEPVSDKNAGDIVAAFESSKRRLLIVGESGTGKTMAAYSIIEYLDEAEGAERIPLLVNLSAREAHEDFESFLVDYLCSSVGYEVRERAVASAFISSDRYALILDGLDEIPAGLRQQFSERLDEFVRGLPGEIGVVVTCRTQEYEQLLAAHATGLGLVQAVEILPLTSEQLDIALSELAKFDEDWEVFLSQRHLRACQRARGVLSNPLFLNLAVAGRLRPRQLLLECDEEQEVRDLVIDGYLDRTLADQRHYEPEAARRYLTWIARFLNGAEVSPFGLKTTDFTVFDLADLTPPDPPRRYRLFAALASGLMIWLMIGLIFVLVDGVRGLVYGLVFLPFGSLSYGLVIWLIWELGRVLLSRWTEKRSALSSRLTLVWPSTRQRRRTFLRNARRGLLWGLLWGLLVGLFYVTTGRLVVGLVFVLVLTPALALVFGLVEPRSVLITSRTMTEASSRSLITALTWTLIISLVVGLIVGLVVGYGMGVFGSLDVAVVVGLSSGLFLGLNNGGWFVLLQKVAHRRLARAGNLPPHPYDFLEWGIEQQIFRRLGGGVRFRHNLIQQHLVNASEGVS
jgi:hypothetical protein